VSIVSLLELILSNRAVGLRAADEYTL
jgi:hypothetical protein